MLRQGFVGFLMLTAAALLGRIVMVALLLATVIAFASIHFGGGFSSGALGSLASLGASLPRGAWVAPSWSGSSWSQTLDHVASLFPGSPGRYQTISVLDVPAEIERRRQARGAYVTSGGSLIVPIDR